MITIYDILSNCLSCFQPLRKLCAKDVSPIDPRLGPYFSDGQRRVDYVLAYHIQKPSSVRRRSSKFGDNTFIRRLRRSISIRSSRAPLQPKEDPEVAAQEQQDDYHEDDKRFRREEFEENLLEMGLELEKDEEVGLISACVRVRACKCLYMDFVFQSPQALISSIVHHKKEIMSLLKRLRLKLQVAGSNTWIKDV